MWINGEAMEAQLRHGVASDAGVPARLVQGMVRGGYESFSHATLVDYDFILLDS